MDRYLRSALFLKLGRILGMQLLFNVLYLRFLECYWSHLVFVFAHLTVFMLHLCHCSLLSMYFSLDLYA